MGVLSGLEPERVFYYFEQICGIPHGSYREKEISDYLTAFAKEHAFTVYQDSLYNVVMLVPASEGYEQEEPLILQGHMDMVCVKKRDAAIDMDKEGLTLLVEGDYITAKDTTLGGDDGIAVAYMLAIAESDSIPHPPLELVITVSEEVGMEGAAGIDLSMLKGHRMLNLDSEEEGVFLGSCAGGVSLLSRLSVVREQSPEVGWFTLSVTGLLGGHSGCEIDKGRANANKILGRILYEMKKQINVYLYEAAGGKKDNAIPVEAYAVVGITEGERGKAEQLLETLNQTLKEEYAGADGDIEAGLLPAEEMSCKTVLDSASFSKVVTLLMVLPDGVQGMSMTVPGLVETSLNLGVLKLNQNELFLQHALRSSVTTKKRYLADRVESLVAELGGSVERKGEYPAWEYREDSVIRPAAVKLYERLYGKKPVVMGIHAGLECGLLAAKIENLDCISLGPDILDIHTTEERLSISSTRRVYKFLLELLKQKEEKLCG
ncbi:MAG: aminoacyl-histidine dipeptidase [Bacteroidales bacterium]|nr:aminoacyl-histidine dipeptidase [Clostridium sp.]MCM1202522.1 aminoacyl-histidine dipeptidase [Bacteroidales bacterium]